MSTDGLLRTNAMYLNPVTIQDSDGVPPLPLEVDDDFITRDDMLLVQPGQQHSLHGRF